MNPLRRKRIGRRALLAGLGGAAVSLPFLDAMRGSRARAEVLQPPTRYVICFAGNSTGTDHDLIVPDTVGRGYDLKPALAPLAMHDNVSSDISIVSGLKIPWEVGGVVPTGGRGVDFHDSMMSPLLSGMRSEASSSRVNGPTSDQIVANVVAGDAPFRSLEYRIQASHYRGGDDRGTISHGLDASGDLVSNPPIASPRIAYDQLFRSFTPTDPVEAELRRRILERDRSVVDLVSQSSDELMRELGTADKARLQRHFDEIRALETRLSMIAPDTMGACMMLPDPGEDPPISIMPTGYDASDVNTAEMGWANEQLRAQVMCDLTHMAFACDLTRVVSLMFTFPQSFMSVEHINGVVSDFHELSHGQGTDEQWAQAIGWIVGWFGYLTAKLRDTPDVEGSMLDNTALVLVFEGGWGYDPADDANGHAHSTENMVVLVGGRAGGLSGGQHIRAVGEHPGKVLNAVLGAVGVDGQLGEISGEIPGLRSSA